MNGAALGRPSFYRVWAPFHALVFVAASRLLNRSMFAGGEQDGFFVQIRDAKANLNVLGELGNPTRLLHLVRYVTVYPFDWLFSNGYDPTFEAVLMVLFLLPPVLVRFKDGYRHPAQPILFYLPLFVSYRAALVSCGMAYLFIWVFISNRRNVLLAVSAFLVNLSSGAVMGWIAVMAVNSSSRVRLQALARRKKWTTAVVVLAVLGFGYSIRSKIDFFFSGATSGSSGALGAISRNTLVSSIAGGQWLRAAFYSAILVSVFWILLSVRRLSLTRQTTIFYLIALPSFLFEGLGPMSYVIPVVWFFLYIQPGRAPASVRPSMTRAHAAAYERAPHQPGLQHASSSTDTTQEVR